MNNRKGIFGVIVRWSVLGIFASYILVLGFSKHIDKFLPDGREYFLLVFFGPMVLLAVLFSIIGVKRHNKRHVLESTEQESWESKIKERGLLNNIEISKNTFPASKLWSYYILVKGVVASLIIGGIYLAYQMSTLVLHPYQLGYGSLEWVLYISFTLFFTYLAYIILWSSWVNNFRYILLKDGIMVKERKEYLIPFSSIISVQTTQGFLEKPFNIARITITTSETIDRRLNDRDVDLELSSNKLYILGQTIQRAQELNQILQIAIEQSKTSNL